jgi:AraC-like DNA-binding protein
MIDKYTLAAFVLRSFTHCDIISNMLNVLIDSSSERKIIDMRKLKFRDLFVLGRYTYAHAHKPLEKHTHGKMIELCLQDEGAQSYHIAGKDYRLRGGDVLLTFPNELHGSGGTPQNRGRLYWMLIRVPGKNERFLNLPPAEGQTLIHGLLSVMSRHFKGRRLLKYYLERIFKAHDSEENTLRDAEIRNWTLRFLLDVLADARQFADSHISYQMKQVLEHIGKYAGEGFVSLEELAALAKLSLPRFKARFKQETGFTPHNYMMLQKIEEAKAELLRSKKSVTDIGLALGFPSSQYFATVFKRYTNQTPKQFRQQCQA